MDYYVVIEGELSLTPTISGEIDLLSTIEGELEKVTEAGGYRPPELEAKEATPSTEEQVITCDAGYDGLQSVTRHPIPSNYGLITWNGSTLTVS